MKFFEKARKIEKAAESFDEFKGKEDGLIEKAGGFLMKLVPDKFRKEATAMLAAFSIFASASSAFAEEGKEEKLKVDLFPKDLISETVKQEDFKKKDDFEWMKKIASKIEISVGGRIEDIPSFQPEVVESQYYEDIKDSKLFNGVSRQEFGNALNVFLESIDKSNNAQEFFNLVKKDGGILNNKEKLLFLKNLGQRLGETYNEDMLNSGEHIEVSDEAMFLGLKNGTDTGLCGNIHTFLVKTAKSLGVEAWLQSGFQKGPTKESSGNHVFSGLIAEIDGEKQIVFLNYDTLIPAGTLDYRDALGVWERHNESVATFSSYVGNENETLFPVKSRAQEVIEKSAGVEDTGLRLEEQFKTGELRKEQGLEINLSPEIREFKITKDTIGLVFLNYQDIYNNPYQSLEDMSALRGRWSPKGDHFGLESDVTVIHGNVKDLYGGSSAFNELIGRLATDYINDSDLSKGEYGKFILNYGTTLQAGIRLPLDKEISSQSIRGMGEGTLGARLVYFDPVNIGKFYIGVSEVYRGQKNDFQNQDLIIKKAAETLTIGAEVKVNEAQILNFEAAKSELDWGNKLKIKGGFVGEKWKAGVGHEKVISDYERFVPSSEKISAEVGYKGGPKWKWEINIIGSKTREKYKDAKSEDIYGTEVKMRMFLW